MSDSYLAEMDEMQDMVAQSLFDDEQAIYAVLAPDGVPFGMQDHVLDTPSKVQQYLLGFKGNPQAQQQWISERVQESINMLEDAGVPVEAAAQNDTRVWEGAMEAALYYSAKMESMVAQFEKRKVSVG